MNKDHPWVAADCVVFDRGGRLLLIRRKYPPFQNDYALPGGFVEVGETTESAALRELKEETGIEAANPRLVGVYSQPGRDPRHHTITVAYLILLEAAAPAAGDDAAAAEFVSDWKGVQLAFDHRKIVEDALRVREGSAG